jgi:lariat debranching enzyme
MLSGLMPHRAPAFPFLVVGIGDIHGRFSRLREWCDELCRVHQVPIALGLSVGDVEAFRDAGDLRRKATKRSMPAEFADFADGTSRLPFPLAFIGGNNEDFEALAPIPKGAELAPGISYLGRSGSRRLSGLKVAYLSGIYAPRFFDAPLAPPLDAATRKHAGYYRRPEVEALRRVRNVDFLLVHEWPRGLAPNAGPEGPSPWMGSPITRRLVHTLRPRWVLCGHGHRPWAAQVDGRDGQVTRVVCLGELESPEESLVWFYVEGGRVRRVGFGFSTEGAWEEGQPWDVTCLPGASGEPIKAAGQ